MYPIPFITCAIRVQQNKHFDFLFIPSLIHCFRRKAHQPWIQDFILPNSTRVGQSILIKHIENNVVPVG
jgi:hypothetical protein